MTKLNKLFETLQLEDMDKWWQDEDQMKQDIEKRIDKVNKAAIGGASEKYLVHASNGHMYIFKPASGSRTIPPIADELSAKLGSKIRGNGGYVPIFRVTLKIDGEHRVGSIQPMVPDITQKDYRNPDQQLSELSSEDIIELCKEQVLDWIIANHDAHGNQFIRKDGRLIGIDKSQAMKYFGDDVLGDDWGDYYHPNKEYGEDYPIYKYIFSALKNNFKQVDIPKLIEEVKHTLDKIDDLDDDEFMSYFIEYFDELKRGKIRKGEHADKVDSDIKKLKTKLLQRKQSIRKDFTTYYKKMLGNQFAGF
jgi:hypothetical protein